MKDGEKISRGIALFMGMIMIVTMFSVLPGFTTGYIENGNNAHLEVTGSTLDGQVYHAGQDVTFSVKVYNRNDTDTLRIFDATISDPHGYGTTLVTATVHHNDTLNGHDSYTYSGFQIQVPNTEGNKSIDVTIGYAVNESHTSPDAYYTATLYFEVVPSVTMGTQVGEVGSAMSPALYPGDEFRQVSARVRAVGGDISNISLKITVPQNSGIHWSDTNQSTWESIYMSTINSGDIRDFNFRIDVDLNATAGIYNGQYNITYYNQTGFRINEAGTIHFVVEFLPILDASVSEISAPGENSTGNATEGVLTAEQGNNTLSFNVSFTNPGTVALYHVRVSISDLSAGSDLYLSPVLDHFEGSKTVNKTWVDLGNIAPGETKNAYIIAAMDRFIPAGQHKIMFNFQGYIYDNGATDRPSEYRQVAMIWDSSMGTPYSPMWFYDNDGDGIYNSHMDELIKEGSDFSQVKGTYLMLNIEDSSPNFRIGMPGSGSSSTYVSLDDSIVDRELTVSIQNMELVPFRDMSMQVYTGSSSPFMNAVNSGDSWSEVSTLDYLAPNGTVNTTTGKKLDTAEVSFFVSIRPNTNPGVYVVPVEIKGVNAYTMKEFTTQVNMRVEIHGFGPQITVTATSVGNIIPGGTFNMNITIENRGDDTARDLYVIIPPAVTQGPNGDWSIIGNFMEAVSPGFGGNITIENGNISDLSQLYNAASDGSVAVLRQLNISDARDIVDLDEYIASLYESPSAQIYVVKADNLAPGENITLSFTMMANSNMIKGKPYVVPVQMSYVDSYGQKTVNDTGVVVKTNSAGAPYHGEPNAVTHSFLAIDTTNGGLMMLFILFLIFIILIVGLGMGKDKDGKEKKKTRAVPPEPEPQLMEEEDSIGAPGSDETEEQGLDLESESQEEETDFNLNPMEETESGDAMNDGEIEPGFTLDEDLEDVDSGTEPGFTLEEKEEGGSSF